MFNFTTQTIINHLDTEGDKKNLWEPSEGSLNTPVVRIGNIRFDDCSIISVEKKLPNEEIKAHVTFDLDKFNTQLKFLYPDTTKFSARVAFYIGLTQSSNDAYYANNLVYKGKPIYTEFPFVVDNTEKAAHDLVKLANKVFNMDGPILKAGAAENKVKFTAVNGYQIIREAALQVYDPTLTNIDCCNSEGGFVNVILGVQPDLTDTPILEEQGNMLVAKNVEFTKKVDGSTLNTNTEEWIYPGVEAFGDYEWIMHNLRIPTCANTNYWSLTKQMGELPAAEASYIQYTIRMQKVRDNIAGEVVGQRAVTVTTHVLYIKNDLANIIEFEKMLEGLISVYGTKVNILYGADKVLAGQQAGKKSTSIYSQHAESYKLNADADADA